MGLAASLAPAWVWRCLPWLGGILAESIGLEFDSRNSYVLLIALATFLLYEGILWRDGKQPAALPLPTG